MSFTSVPENISISTSVPTNLSIFMFFGDYLLSKKGKSRRAGRFDPAPWHFRPGLFADHFFECVKGLGAASSSVRLRPL